MKYLGVDYGTKRIGLAISDSGGQIATAYEIVENQTGAFEYIGTIIKKEGVQALVLGYSCNLDGSENIVQKHIKKFSELATESWSIPVYMHTEQFSSMQAKWGVTKSVRRNTKQDRHNNRIKSPEHIDSGAASIVLQSFLDMQQS